MRNVKNECLQAMGRAVMLNHGGNPDDYDWQAVFADVDEDKILHDKVKVFNLVRSRVDTLLKEKNHA